VSPLENAYRIVGDDLQIAHREVEKTRAKDENASYRVLNTELSVRLVPNTEARRRLQEISGVLGGEVGHQDIEDLMLIIRTNFGKAVVKGAVVRDARSVRHILVELKNPGGHAKGTFQEDVAIATQTSGARNINSPRSYPSVDYVILKRVEEAGTLESGSESFPPTAELIRMCGLIEGFSGRTTFRAHPLLTDTWGLITVGRLPTGRGGGSAY